MAVLLGLLGCAAPSQREPPAPVAMDLSRQNLVDNPQSSFMVRGQESCVAATKAAFPSQSFSSAANIKIASACRCAMTGFASSLSNDEVIAIVGQAARDNKTPELSPVMRERLTALSKSCLAATF